MRYIRLTVALLLVACGDDGTTPTGPPTPTIPVATSIALSTTSLNLTSLGQKQQLTATVKDQNGATVSGTTVTWATTEPGVATVSSAGLVTSIGNGTGAIIAVYGSISATASVSVTAQVPATIELSDTLVSFVSLGDTATLRAQAKDASGENISVANFIWISADETIASVSADGLITAVSNGTTSITATAGPASAAAATSIQQDAASITLLPDSLVFAAPGDTATIAASVLDAGGSEMASSPTLTWSSSDLSTVTVNSSGIVTAVASGLATVTAQAGNLESTVNTRVKGSSGYLAVTVTGDGDPLPDVDVWLTDPTGTNTKKTTDSAGIVLFRDLWAGENTVTLEQLPTGLTLAPTNPQTVQITENEGHDLVFTGIFAPAQISGTATSWGKAVEGAVVRIEGKDTLEVTVNSTGVFQVDSIRRGGTGAYTLSISNHAGVRFKETTLTQTLQSGANSSEFIGKPDGLVWESVSGGYMYSCAVTTGGGAYCWGNNEHGQLGDGTTTDRYEPRVVMGDHSWASVNSGFYHTCGITTAGKAYCWGDNYAGKLGDGTSIDHYEPTLVSGGNTWASMSRPGSRHTCAVTTAGESYCWGYNFWGQLGDGTTTEQKVPKLVTGEHTWASVDVSGSHSCGLTIAGEAYCWGYNNWGQLGDGTTTNSSAPVLVSGGRTTWSSVSGGYEHTCGMTTLGETYCWGSNGSGQLGDGTITNRNEPTLVSGGYAWSSVDGGGWHTCGVTSTDNGYCWGRNKYGGLGDGTITTRRQPVAISGVHVWVSITGGSENTCGLTSAGEVYCWGRNSYGGVGDGTTTNRSVPIKVGGNW